MHSPQRRRLRQSRIVFFISGLLLCIIYTLTQKARLLQPQASMQADKAPRAGGDDGVVSIHIREVITPNETEEVDLILPETTNAPPVIIVNSTDIEQCIYVDPEPPKPLPTQPPPPPTTTTTTTTTSHPDISIHITHRKGDYPPDIFSVQDRRQGWVILHIIGMIYMFVALAIVCDEFFVPALEVITNKLEISDDVAGATFMAAGGSAPELFTSLIGVFIAHSNVGIGTIVGSAVFNILFVIGMCAIFSKEMLHLTWWPLFRDVSFYILDLILLITFFLDNFIMWWESIILVLAYLLYVSFMKFNITIEQAVKSQINKHMSIVKVWTAEEPEKESEPPPAPAPPAPKNEDKSKTESEPTRNSPKSSKTAAEPQEDKARLRVRPVLQRGGSTASLHNTSLRNTIFQLMIHTLDPLGEGNDMPEPKADQASSAAAAGGAAVEPSTSQPPKTEETSEKTADQPEEEEKVPEGTGGTDGSGGNGEDESGDEECSDSSESDEDDDDEKEEEKDDEEDEDEPLSLDWPDTRRKQATYLFLLPIVLPLWLTVPDVRRPESKRFFVFTFLGSILWIAVFSYLMVWWAHQVGETVGISEEIMGLTILAAGTSIPDLITSVIVARKGLGDMAVSSSVGSNIFDITVGLPVPWLMFTMLHNGEPVTVSSNGLFCAIVLLFLMLLFVIFSIAMCRWRMSKKLGLTMFALYFVFLVLSVLLEDRIITCPVSI
ncbi:sodium/potassium/calcium exchanger 1-like isoform X2 [Myripristis murdjan]|uniref:sodium/potassium/calcium exchanger 1-like isoform X2 n=1 Tax=Myripristis murdjan TaxID=586833 RepID=UPI0011760EC8|nr:sodium/potassium/calcium exchanger 1-like isoform X2 [Myripristis murdjan]